jgi:hypothetical protein
MTTRRAVRKTTKTSQGPVDPETKLTQRALKLPWPGPGITIDVAERLLPTYLAIYHLVPMSPDEVREFELRNNVSKPAGVVWVKRVKKASKQETDVQA